MKKNLAKAPYKKAPILEAIIDIVAQLPEKTKQSDIEKFNKQFKSTYPTQEKIVVENAIIFPTQDGTKFSSSKQELGYKLVSSDKKFVAQIKTNGFTFSQVGAYEDWSRFSKEAKKLWELFSQKFKPIKINRVAVRYINRIDIPSVNFEMTDYFTTYPHVLKDNQAQLSGFLLQAQIPQKEGGLAILNQAVSVPVRPDHTSIVLDIDVFEMKEYKADDNTLWKRIELLREQKNALFEKSITTKTRKLFV